MSYKILIFGKTTIKSIHHNDIDHDNAEIIISNYPNDRDELQQLDKYDIIITDLDTFTDGRSYRVGDEAIFRKSIKRAFNRGVYLCFLHYKSDLNRSSSYGLKVLQSKDVDVNKSAEIIIDGTIKNNLFRYYLNHWGATYLYFSATDANTFEDIIYQDKSDTESLAFTLKENNGLYIYLPYQINHDDLAANTDAIYSLIDVLLNFKSKKATYLPDWAEDPYFKEEVKISKELEDLRTKVENTKNELEKFTEVKSLLTSREYDLENRIPKFLQEYLSLNIHRDEKFNEDFWILNEKDEEEVICEVKSVSKGFRKSFIYKLYNHRDEYNLDEKFPGLLVVNHHLQAGSWKDKNKHIDKQDYKTASDLNILILRVEDLVNLWDGIRQNEISNNVFELIRNNSGWCRIDNEFNITFLD